MVRFFYFYGRFFIGVLAVVLLLPMFVQAQEADNEFTIDAKINSRGELR